MKSGAVIGVLVILIPIALLFTGIGIYAWRRKKPMWFWSGSTVREEEITDIPAYNRANGIMWIAYSLVFWLSAAAAAAHSSYTGILIIGGGIFGGIALVFAYQKIYDKYRRK